MFPTICKNQNTQTLNFNNISALFLHKSFRLPAALLHAEARTPALEDHKKEHRG